MQTPTLLSARCGAAKTNLDAEIIMKYCTANIVRDCALRMQVKCSAVLHHG